MGTREYHDSKPGSRRLFPALYLLFISIFITGTCFSQVANSVWNFGSGCRVDFSPGVPVSGFSYLQTNEGSASISDEAGHLLLYTDGITIWGADDAQIEGSGNLGGDPSSSQSALILPWPGHPGKYYVFTTAAQLGLASIAGITGTAYSIVDLNENGGTGLVAPVNVVMLDSSAEKLTAVKTCGNAFWVVAHGWNNSNYYAWKLDSAGLGQPVISSVGAAVVGSSLNGYIDAIGNIRFSFDGKKLASVNSFSALPLIELFDFDTETGIISGGFSDAPATPFQVEYPYGLCFSPDNSKLYITTSNDDTTSLYQYTAQPETQAAFLNSRFRVNSHTGLLTSVDLAPDNKIYIGNYGKPTLSIIEYPNLQGNDCSYMPIGLQLQSPCVCYYGLQNFYSDPSVSIKQDILLFDTLTSCGNSVTLNSGVNADDLMWSTGEITSEITVEETGEYSVSFNNACISYKDTVFVNFAGSVAVGLISDTVFCNIHSIELNPETNSENLDFTWSTGDTGDSLIVTNSGNYFVIATNHGCSDTAYVTLVFSSIPDLNLGDDTLHCFHEPFILQPDIPEVNYLWSDGSTSPTLTIPSSGHYWLRISNAFCSTSDSINAIIKGQDSVLKIPNVFTPNGDAVNEYFAAGDPLLTNYALSIFNRWGKEIFHSDDPLKYWDGTTDGKQCMEGVYFYKCQYMDPCSQDLVEREGAVTLLY